MQQPIKTVLLSILASVLLAGLLPSVGIATYVWWTYDHGNRFCGTPLAGVAELVVVAIVLFSCLVWTLRLAHQKEKRGVTPGATPRQFVLCSKLKLSRERPLKHGRPCSPQRIALRMAVGMR
jgi:hypothetical protein